MSFARTKLLPPRSRPGLLIERPALQQRLTDALLNRRLVLLCAGAGHGKTAALAQQVHTLPGSTALAWIAADAGDDLALLLECLVVALDPWDLPWRTAPEALVAAVGDAAPRARRRITEELINTLDACEVAHGVIVIDDLHRIDDVAVYAFLDHLLERLSPRWTLALASRRAPPLALARLRAAGELADFREADLRFDADDTRQLIAGAGLDAAHADALLRRTAGWAAGLRLAVDALGRGTVDAGAIDRPLLEFLDAEVIDRLPDELRVFLLRSAVLPELNADRAAAVTGNPRAAALLDELLHHGVFVTPLDGTEPTLRLHDLLREALERRLAREHADELPALLRRAAVGEPDVRRRIGWLLRAGAHDEAQHALAEAAPALLAAGDSARVLRLLEAFPAPMRETSPLLAYVRGLASWPRFEWAVMDRSLATAATGFAAAGHAVLARRSRAWRIIALAGLGQLDACRTELDTLAARPADAVDVDVQTHLHLMDCWLGAAVGPDAAPAQHLAAMLHTLHAGSGAALWYRSAPHFMFIGRPGMLPPLQAYVDGALAVAGDTHLPLRAAALALSAWALLWQGRLPEADAAMAQAREDDRWLGGQRSLRIPVLAYDAARATLAGDAEGVRRHGQAMIDDVDHDPTRRPAWYGVYVMNTGRMALAVGDVATARAMRDRLAAAPAGREWPFMAAARRLLEAGLLLHDGAVDAALPLLEDAVEPLSACGVLGLDASARVLAAHARALRGELDAAAAWLSPVLARAPGLTGDPAGEVGGAWLTGHATLAALADVDWHGRLPAAGIGLLTAWRDTLAPRSTCTEAAPAFLGDAGLSAREREVLACIAAGDSNKLIARALDLSPHTVKRHVANILDKLALNSRGQAAAWWAVQSRR